MSCKQTRAARPLQIEPLFSAVDQITCAGNLSHKNVAFGALTVCPGVCSSPRVGVWAPSYRGIFVFLFSRRWRPSRRKVSARSLTASLFPQTPPGDMKNPSFGTTAPSLTVSGDVILSNQFSPDDEPFAEYLWMEHEEEFNRQVRCRAGVLRCERWSLTKHLKLRLLHLLDRRRGPRILGPQTIILSLD